MIEFARTKHKRITISLIPLIDVSIFMLIFFMLSGTVEKFEIIPIDPPVAKSGKLMDDGHVNILVGRHDELIIGDEIVDIVDMQERLTAELATNPNKVITVKADAVVPANRVIDVMDVIKQSGGKNISIVTQSRAPIYAQ